MNENIRPSGRKWPKGRQPEENEIVRLTLGTHGTHTFGTVSPESGFGRKNLGREG